MIAQLTGQLIKTEPGAIILDVSGVGYRIHVGAATIQELSKKAGSPISLYTHLSIRENAHDLYGFLTHEELVFFELLIGVSGVGPKTALGILHVADVAALKNAIVSGESAHLTKVSGIGRKNAEKIILELKDKLGAGVSTEERAAAAGDMDTLLALETLGYSAKEAREALSHIPKDITETHARLREALKILGTK